jgi:hypothetical protein
VHFVSGMFADLMGSFIWVPQVRRLLACPPRPPPARCVSLLPRSFLVCSHQLQDVVKQRLQVQKTSLASAAADTVKYKGSLHCIKTIIKEEGFLALWTVRTLYLSSLSAPRKPCQLVCVCLCVCVCVWCFRAFYRRWRCTARSWGSTS